MKLESPMTEQTAPLCKICSTRPATTTQPILNHGLATCDACSPAELTLALAGLLMGGPSPLSWFEAHQLALTGVVAAFTPPPQAMRRTADPFSVDGLFPIAMAPALHDAGVAAGAAWAREVATPEQRARLATLCEELDEERLFPFTRDRVPGVRNGADALHAFLHAVELEPGAADAFWRAALAGNDRGQEASGQFVRGFVCGSASWCWCNAGESRRKPPGGRKRRRQGQLCAR
jgi:hypothetical protein